MSTIGAVGDWYIGRIPGVDTKLVHNPVLELAKVKTERELRFMEESAKVVETVFDEVKEELSEGMTELELRNIIDMLLLEKGAERRAYPTIVAFGKNTASPHPVSSIERLSSGDWVMVDFGAMVKGFSVGLCRTFVFGSPSQEQEELFAIVKEGYERMLVFLKPGVLLEKADGEMREFFASEGMVEYALELGGMGVGMTKDGIYVGPGYPGVFVEGMALQLTPALFVPGKGGVKFSDVVVGVPEGTRLLTRVPLEISL